MINFVRLNSIVFAIASIQYLVFLHSTWYILFTFLTLRNFTLVYLLDIKSSKQLYQIDDINFTPYVLQAAGLECATLMMLPTLYVSYIPKTILFFIPVSFLFEIVYDFFHYWIHRSMHITRDSFHKTHHRFFHIRPIITFYQNIFDLILSNSLPFLLTHRIISMIYPLSILDMSLIITYKMFIEIAGHMAESSNNTPSFPQCIWLPRMLGIELYADDHALHHSNTGCNYAKRFALWDKVFGTYVSAKNNTIMDSK